MLASSAFGPLYGKLSNIFGKPFFDSGAVYVFDQYPWMKAYSLLFNTRIFSALSTSKRKLYIAVARM
jgi:hypothetical protein